MARKNYYLISGSMMLLSGLNYAGTMGPVASFNPGYVPLVAVIGGPSFVKPSGPRNIRFDSYHNRYINDSDTQTLGTWGVRLGFEKWFTERFGWQLGASYYQDSVTLIKEQVLLFGSERFHNFDATWNVQTRRVLATGKLLYNLGMFGLKTFVLGEVGGNFDEGYNYRERTIPVDPRADCSGEVFNTYSFAKGNKTSTSWSVGWGLEHGLGAFDFGAAFQFSNFGIGNLTYRNQTLTAHDLHAYQVLFTLAYKFERLGTNFISKGVGAGVEGMGSGFEHMSSESNVKSSKANMKGSDYGMSSSSKQ